MGRGSNMPRVGEYNRAVTLEAIRRSEAGVTRAQLGRLTGLSAQTISNLIRDLMEEGLVSETQTEEVSGRGRPGVHVSLNPRSRFAVGVHLDPASLGLVLLDLAGVVVGERFEPLPSPEEPQRVVDLVHQGIVALTEEANVEDAALLGVGIAAPGPLDRETGLISPPLLPGWNQVPLRNALRERMRTRVLLDKDVAAAAQAHIWRGDISQGDDFLFFYIGAGVAMSTVVDGEVIRGRSGNAGEAGHLTGDPLGVWCQCGKRGCLGASLGEAEMVAQALQEGISLPAPTRAGHPLQIDRAFARLVEVAEAGDERATRLFETAGRSLGMAVASVSELLEISTVVVGGPRWAGVRDLVEPTASRVLESHRLHGDVKPVRLLTSSLGWRVGAVGAACLVLDATLAARSEGLLITG